MNRTLTRSSLGLFALALSFSLSAEAQEQVISLDGVVPDDEFRHFFVPFTVPEGIVEIEVQHDDLSEDNILDWGLEDPNGFRGWGGGNTEPAIVAVMAASRSYLAGPIPAGEWRVVVGKAKIVSSPASYQLTVILRDAPTLAPQPERTPFVAPAPLRQEARWYAGDFHVHSENSGDARPPLDEIATFAKSRGLEFALISDHNTTAQLDFFVAAQKDHPDFLFLPGMEFTTYAGHANTIGSTAWVDHKLELPGRSIASAAQAFRDQGALFSINHPTMDLGELCIGCAWEHTLEPAAIDAIEIQTGSIDKTGILLGESAIEYWDQLLSSGHHLAAIGGSDDHRAGVDLDFFGSPIGTPTTLVFAKELSVQGIIEAVRNSRTVVKLGGPDEPMIEFASSVTSETDTVRAGSITLTATVTGGLDHDVRFVENGAPLASVVVTSDPFVHELTVTAPESGQARYRAEALKEGGRRTVTSHIWLEREPSSPDTAEEDSGCGCRLGARPSSLGGGYLLFALLWLARRRR